MDTRTLVAFKTVCDAGSIGHAAEQLFISPQGLSKSMARLEAELGSALLVRTSRGVEPTRAGRLLYERADQIAGILDSLRQSIAADSAETLRVAASSGYLVRFGAEFRQAFEARNSGYRLAVEEYNDSGVLQALRDGDADCGFASGAIDEHAFDRRLLSRHRFVLLVAADHPLAERGAVGYDDLADLDLVAMGKGHSPFDTIAGRLAAENVHPASLTAIVEISTGIDLARRGESACITTDFAASAFGGGTRTIPFRDPDFTWDFWFVRRKGAPELPVAESLADLACSWLLGHREELF